MTEHPTWRISSFSASGGSCVQMADLGDQVLVRNSNHPDAGTLQLPAEAWGAFLADVKAGALD